MGRPGELVPGLKLYTPGNLLGTTYIYSNLIKSISIKIPINHGDTEDVLICVHSSVSIMHFSWKTCAKCNSDGVAYVRRKL